MRLRSTADARGAVHDILSAYALEAAIQWGESGHGAEKHTLQQFRFRFDMAMALNMRTVFEDLERYGLYSLYMLVVGSPTSGAEALVAVEFGTHRDRALWKRMLVVTYLGWGFMSAMDKCMGLL